MEVGSVSPSGTRTYGAQQHHPYRVGDRVFMADENREGIVREVHPADREGRIYLRVTWVDGRGLMIAPSEAFRRPWEPRRAIS